MNQSLISIRHNLRPGDLGAVIKLHGILYAQEYSLNHQFEGYVAAGLARFADTLDESRDRLWLAERGGEIIGSIGIASCSVDEAQLRWFLVHPSARGQGLGRTLINQALEFCRERQFKTIFLWTLNTLRAASHLYTSAGFIKTEEKTHRIWGRALTEERYDLRL